MSNTSSRKGKAWGVEKGKIREVFRLGGGGESRDGRKGGIKGCREEQFLLWYAFTQLIC